MEKHELNLLTTLFELHGSQSTCMLGPRVCFDGPSLCNNHGVQYRGAGASILTGVGRAISHIFESGG